MDVKLVIQDEVNCKFYGLSAPLRRKLKQKYRAFQPAARHSPQYKLGRWDGYKNFFSTSGATYVALLGDILLDLEQHNINIELEDQRQHYNLEFTKVTEDYISKNCPNGVWPENHRMAGQSICLFEHQVTAINKFLDNPRCLQELCTSFGKTITSAVLSHVCESQHNMRTIVVVPSKSLVMQTEEDYHLLGLDVGVYYGDRKEYKHQHVICTWQSLYEIFKIKKNENEQRLEEKLSAAEGLLDNLGCVMIDECHTAKANVLTELLCGPFSNTPLVWGMTGTVPDNEYDRGCLRITLGDVVHQVRASDLQAKGILSNLHVDILQLDDSAVKFNQFHEEKEYLAGDEHRLEWLAHKIHEISQTGNTLVLVERRVTGNYLSQSLTDICQKEIPFIYGEVKAEERKETYDEMQSGDNQLFVASYGVASVGINIPRIFNLVMLEPGKSFIRVIQSIGRGIRKAHDKDFVHVWDITSSLKFSKKHLSERKKYYRNADYPHTLTRIKWNTTMSNVTNSSPLKTLKHRGKKQEKQS